MIPKKLNHRSAFSVSSKIVKFVGPAASASKAKKKAKSAATIAGSILSDGVASGSKVPPCCPPALAKSVSSGAAQSKALFNPTIEGAPVPKFNSSSIMVEASLAGSSAPASSLISLPPVSATTGSPISVVATMGVSTAPPLLIDAPCKASHLQIDPTSAPEGSQEVPVPPPPSRSYASVLKNSAELIALGSPSEHVSGVPFVLIPDENIEAAKEEFKNFIYACFHGDVPPMGRIIGVVNAVWAKSGPRIYVHRLGKCSFLL